MMKYDHIDKYFLEELNLTIYDEKGALTIAPPPSWTL
jgi:hypothetical protein